MRVVIPLFAVTALFLAACEPEPRTPAEKVGDAVEELVEPEPKTPTEKMGAAVEEAGEDIQDAARN
jgi:predicted small secreted protein